MVGLRACLRATRRQAPCWCFLKKGFSCKFADYSLSYLFVDSLVIVRGRQSGRSGFMTFSQCVVKNQRETRRIFEVWGCSSAGRVPDWQSGGHEFDPRQLHQ